MSTVFVEIVRLFIVVAATAGGFTVAGGSTREGNGPVIGATLGALVGYVAGGAGSGTWGIGGSWLTGGRLVPARRATAMRLFPPSPV